MDARTGLAILAWEHPDLDERLTDREASDVLREYERGGHFAGDLERSKLTQVLEALQTRLTQRAKATLDTSLGALSPVTPDDLEGFEPGIPGIGTPAQLLDLSNVNAFAAAYRWLQETKQPRKAVALLYQVATRGKDLAPGQARQLTQRGWFFLGQEFRTNVLGLREVWPAQTWAAFGREIVLECYARGAASGRAESSLLLGSLYLGVEPFQVELDFQFDVQTAQRHFNTALVSRGFDNEDLDLARLRLAQIALDYPDTPGRLSDETALAFADRVREATPEGGLKHSEAERIYTGLGKRIAESKRGE